MPRHGWRVAVVWKSGRLALACARLNKAFAMSRSISSDPSHQDGTPGASSVAIFARSLTGQVCRTSKITRSWIARSDIAQALPRRRWSIVLASAVRVAALFQNVAGLGCQGNAAPRAVVARLFARALSVIMTGTNFQVAPLFYRPILNEWLAVPTIASVQTKICSR